MATPHIHAFPLRWLYLTAALVAAAAICLAETRDTDYPSRPIKLIIPFSAGGSSDTFSRIIAKTIRDENLLPQPLVIINVNGASGTIGSRRVKNARPDGYTLMMLHEAILTAKHAGLAPYGAEAFETVAATGENVAVLTASKNSDLKTLSDVLEYATNHPNELIYGTAIGAPTHLVGLLVEQAHGSAKFRFAQAGSGAQRISALAGGHIDLSPFSIGEYLRYESAGIKALAVFSDERHELIPNLPTAAELGIPVSSLNRNFWWFPKGTPQERIDVIADALEKAMQSEYTRSKLALSAIAPSFLSGQALKNAIAERNQNFSSLTLVKTDSVPNFAMWTLALSSLLLATVFFRRRLSKKNNAETAAESSRTPAKAWIVFGVTLAYAGTIASETIGYSLATSAYILAICFIVGGFSLRIATRALPFSLLLGFGLFYLFTEVLTIDLPG